MEKAFDSGHTENIRGVASRRLSPVLEMALQSEASLRSKASEPRSPHADLSHGGREPDLENTAHSWRAPDAGLRCIGTHGLALTSTSAEEPDINKGWLTFLQNHREAITTINFFTVPTITFN